MNKEKRANQFGRSMIEMLGVLAIIGVLSVGGIAGYTKAMTKFKINRTIEQITSLASGIQQLYLTQKNYVGVICNGEDTCQVLHSLDIIPSDMIRKNTKILYSQWNTEVHIWLASKYGVSGTYNDVDDDKAFVIYFTFDSEDDKNNFCVPLAMHDWSKLPGIIAIGGNPSDEVFKSYIGCNGNHSTIGDGDGSISIGCTNGKNVSIPLSAKDAIDTCQASDLALKFY